MYVNILMSATQIFESSTIIYYTFNFTQAQDMLGKNTQKDAIQDICDHNIEVEDHLNLLIFLIVQTGYLV